MRFTEMKYLYLILSIVVVLQGCNSSERNISEIKKWSLDLAETAIIRNDTLARYNNPSKIKWQYDIAMLGEAIYMLKDADSKYSDYYSNFIDYFVTNEGSIKKYNLSDFNLDFVNPAKGLLCFYEIKKEEKYLKALDTIMLQIKMQPRTHNGGFWHKKIYPDQVWLNSTYMLDPFLARYAKLFNEPQWYDSACFNLILTYNLTVDSTDGLMCHAWDESKSQVWADPVTGKSPNKWGRGMGWYLMALVDVLEILPEDHKERKNLEKILLSVSESLLKVKDKKMKLWYQVLYNNNQQYNYIETSCSAMFIYSFAKAYNLGLLPVKYYDVAVESFNSLVKNFIKIDKDQLPTLTNICGQAGIGGKVHKDGSFGYYINQEQIDNDPKGIAPLIMASVEIGKNLRLN